MDVATTSWQLVTATNGDKFVVQNTGVSRIGFLIAASQPAVGAVTLDGGAHGVFQPGMQPLTITELTADGLYLFVRSLGSKSAKLYVS